MGDVDSCGTSGRDAGAKHTGMFRGNKSALAGLTMKFAILVTAAPGTPMAHHALAFTRAALEAGHQVVRVFFYGDGVYNANRLASPPSDEHNPTSAWQALATNHSLELIVCVAAAVRRGVLDEDEAKRQEREGHSLASGFTLSGLGQLVDATVDADRLMHFGERP